MTAAPPCAKLTPCGPSKGWLASGVLHCSHLKGGREPVAVSGVSRPPESVSESAMDEPPWDWLDELDDDDEASPPPEDLP